MKAPGWPGAAPTWTTGAKTAVGTAVGDGSRVWYTIAKGIVTEVYYPRQDEAALRDAQLLIHSSDGGFWEEKRDLSHSFRYVDSHAPACELVSADPDGRFRIVKRIAVWDKAPVLAVKIRFEVLRGETGDYRAFWLVAPHLDNQGMGNDGRVTMLSGRIALEATRHTKTVCLASTVPFVGGSAGYVGVSDGWTHLSRGEFPIYEEALDGNIALTAELDLSRSEQTLLIGFGRKPTEARFAAAVALHVPYEQIEHAYVAGWRRYLESLSGLLPDGHPHAVMQRISAIVLRTHQDKLFSGGLTASLSIPWGETVGDGQGGGYHLVWSRDMVEAAQALLALGDVEGAVDALRYLMVTQRADGSWPQNFWLDGVPYWNGSQLDETALPVHLAHSLVESGALVDTGSVYDMVRRALGHLVRHGPTTEQDRWEENAGYSPFTLATAVASLVLGADLARRHGDADAAAFAEGLADYWNARIEEWTFVEDGDLVPGHPRYYERIRPTATAENHPSHARIPVKNHPGEDLVLDTRMVDGGFLQLVRSGLRQADDPRIKDSVALYDTLLKTETPAGPVWHRYNDDGYGEQDDGTPFTGFGRGRGWPLLTGERGHYALAAGEDPEPYLRAMEAMASEGGMIPEQVWDTDDIPEKGLLCGRPTGSAMPLVWAHAEYVKLLKSACEGRVWDRCQIVADRYKKPPASVRLHWLFCHRPTSWTNDMTDLRVVAEASADLVFTRDDWATVETARLNPCEPLGVHFADIPLADAAAVEFTFFWTQAQRWEGRNFRLVRETAQITPQ